MRLYVGFITYGDLTAKYLSYFLPSLKNQTFKDFKIVAVDNSEAADNDNAKYLKSNFPEVDLKRPGENLGFAKAFNLMIKEAAAGADYFLALNPDMILEPKVAEKLINAMDNDNQLGSATAKILKWDFANLKKTNIIDSCGLKLLPGLRFVDYNEGRPADSNCQDKIIGASGSLAIYRVSALEKVKRSGQYFDELMFMYKEDCDLAYRLFLQGFKSACVNQAIIYHDRSGAGAGTADLAVALNRKNKSRQIKQWSFLNQQIIFIKYWRLQSLANKIAIIWFEFKMLAFILFFEPYLLKEYFEVFRIKNKITIYKGETVKKYL